MRVTPPLFKGICTLSNAAIIFSIYLRLLIDTHKNSLLDLEPPVNGVDEEGELALTMRIRIGGSLDLAFTELNTHFSKDGAALLDVNECWRLHSAQKSPKSLKYL